MDDVVLDWVRLQRGAARDGVIYLAVVTAEQYEALRPRLEADRRADGTLEFAARVLAGGRWLVGRSRTRFPGAVSAARLQPGELGTALATLGGGKAGK
jgi:hypothetical protein